MEIIILQHQVNGRRKRCRPVNRFLDQMPELIWKCGAQLLENYVVSTSDIELYNIRIISFKLFKQLKKKRPSCFVRDC